MMSFTQYGPLKVKDLIAQTGATSSQDPVKPTIHALHVLMRSCATSWMAEHAARRSQELQSDSIGKGSLQQLLHVADAQMMTAGAPGADASQDIRGVFIVIHLVVLSSPHMSTRCQLTFA